MRSLFLLVCWVTVASAEPREPGLQFRVGLGTGYATGTFTPDGSIDVTGVPVSTEISIGTTIGSGLVIGGGTFSMIVPSPSYGGVSSGANHISGTGPFIDYFFDARRRVHLQAALLFTAGYLQGKDGAASTTGFGFGGEVGVGYDIPISDAWSVGPIVRVVYYELFPDSATFDLVVPSALVAFTYH